MGFYDGTTPAMRMGFYGFCGAAGAFAVTFVGESLGLRSIALAGIALGTISIVIGGVGMFFAPHHQGSIRDNRQLAFWGFCGTLLGLFIWSRPAVSESRLFSIGAYLLIIGGLVVMVRGLFLAKPQKP